MFCRPLVEPLEQRLLLAAAEATVRITGGGSQAIQAALDAAQPGDIIEIAAGNYDDSNRIEVTTSGTATGHIVLRAEAGARPLLPRLRFSDAQHWRVTGFEIAGHPGGTGIDVRGGGSQDLVFADLLLHHLRKGIYFRDGSNFELKNSTLYELTAGVGTDAIGVQIFMAQNVRVKDSEIYDFTGDAIHVTDGPDDILVDRELILIDGNQIHIDRPDYRGCTENAIDVKGEYGGTVVFTNNVVYGFEQADFLTCSGPTASGCNNCHAINMNSNLESGGSHLIVAGNLIYDSHAAVDTDIWSAEIYNNVFYALTHRGISVDSDRPVEIYHNTFVSLPEAVGDTFGNDALVSNNLFYDAGPVESATTHNAFFGNSYSPSPAGNSPLTGNGPEDEPGLADPNGLDFQLSATSQLINAGADLGILLDFAGNSRDTWPDIGAFEFPADTPNQLPIADAGGPYATDEGTSVALDASQSADPDGTIVSYEWDLNNDSLYDHTGITANFSSNQHGTHVIRLRVTDDRGSSSTQTALVNVANVAPTADAGGAYTGNEGSSIDLDGTNSNDPAFDIVSYDWDFDNDGQYDDASGATVRFSSTADGLFTVGLRVTDDGQAVSTDTAQVNVSNVAPSADAGGPYTVRQAGDVTLNAGGSSDPGNDISQYAWDLDNDGQFDDAVGVTATFNSATLGNHTVGVRVSDDDGASSTAETTVAVTVNQPPQASDDFYAVEQQTTLATAAPGVLTGDSDPNGDSLTALLVAGPAHGALALSSDGSFTYAPNGGFVGTDSFSYRAFDGVANSNVATVTLTVNEAPPAPALFYFSLTNSDVLPGVGVTTEDEDIVAYNGTEFRMLFDGSDLGLDSLDINAFNILDDGSILISFKSAATFGSWGQVDDSDILKFLPTSLGENTAGSFEFYFDGSDVELTSSSEDIDALEVLGDGTILISTTATASVSTVTAAAEDLLAFSPTQLGETTSGTWSLHFDGSDVELSDVLSGEDVDAVAVGVNGSYFFSTTSTFAVAGLSGEDEDIFKFVPATLGEATWGSFEMFSDGSTLDLAPEDINALDISSETPNQVPLARDDNYTAEEDSTLVVDANGVLINDSDGDGDPLSALLASGVVNGTLALQSDGSLSYTPHADFNGSDSFTYRAHDGTSDSKVATVSITITPLNDAPAAASQSWTVKQDTTKLVTLAASDADGDSLTYQIESGPTRGTLSGTAPNLSYTPNAGYTGPDSFSFRASDGTLDSNLGTVSISVVENSPPVADDQTVSTAEDTELRITLTAADSDGDPLTFTVASAPTHGDLSGTAPNLTYHPAANFAGQDSFTFQAHDGTDTSNVATVSISVAAAPPEPPVLFYFSLTNRDDLPGVAVQVQDEDILAFNGSEFELLFDGSDVGLSAVDINAFSILDDGNILMSFKSAATVGPLGEVDDSDIVKFLPTNLGENTSGSFKLYFDGSDVGLNSSNEDIDGLEVLSDGRLLISLTAGFSLAGVSGGAEDLLIFTPTQLGATTSGSWSIGFDGSDVELSDISDGEDVDAVALGSEGRYYLSTVSGEDEDIFAFVPSSLGDATSGSFELFVDGSTIGLAAEDINALDLPSSAANQTLAAQLGSAAGDAGASFTVSRAAAEALSGHATPSVVWLSAHRIPLAERAAGLFDFPQPRNDRLAATRAAERFTTLHDSRGRGTVHDLFASLADSDLLTSLDEAVEQLLS